MPHIAAATFRLSPEADWKGDASTMSKPTSEEGVGCDHNKIV